MHQTLLLVAPSANRVYAGSAPELTRAEVETMFDHGLLAPTDPAAARVDCVRLAGVDYVRIDIPEPLTDSQIAALSTVSSGQALYAIAAGPHVGEHAGEPVGEDDAAPGEDVLLRPIARRPLEVFGSDLVTIQKYTGKTNEQFTALLLNVTAAVSAWPQRLLERRLHVLDPMCGRGTTLNQALAYGLSATGVDIDGKDTAAYETFLLTYLRTHKVKHRASRSPLHAAGRRVGNRWTVELAAAKDDFAAGRVQRVDVLTAHTAELDGLLRPGSVDLIVTDTPYGVQHASHADRRVRRPLELVTAAMPGWVRLLRTGGAIGLAYNRHVVAPDDLRDVLSRNGLSVVMPRRPDAFRHRVDQSIDRDIVLARKEPADRSTTAATERHRHG